MRPWDSVTGTRCTRCTPASYLSRDQAPLPLTAGHDLLDPLQVGLALGEHLDLVAVLLGPAGVHAVGVAGEQGGLVAAGAGPDLDDHVLAVVGGPWGPGPGAAAPRGRPGGPGRRLRSPRRAARDRRPSVPHAAAGRRSPGPRRPTATPGRCGRSRPARRGGATARPGASGRRGPRGRRAGARRPRRSARSRRAVRTWVNRPWRGPPAPPARPARPRSSSTTRRSRRPAGRAGRHPVHSAGGSTCSSERMATSIMSGVGGLVVSICSHRPKAASGP